VSDYINEAVLWSVTTRARAALGAPFDLFVLLRWQKEKEKEKNVQKNQMCT
jgi:hypothetical protein